eukprot:TRINITY_DN10221_c0_g1_i1.p2 TRINITY_DN10221_c0_g1~~TRINITY_DN10221_c0_g1_i1.p2  ORF type:complete len:229 (+),score=43.56 TRINITY_DN10221_c0_g1_i1:96-782(+)
MRGPAMCELAFRDAPSPGSDWSDWQLSPTQWARDEGAARAVREHNAAQRAERRRRRRADAERERAEVARWCIPLQHADPQADEAVSPPEPESVSPPLKAPAESPQRDSERDPDLREDGATARAFFDGGSAHRQGEEQDGQAEKPRRRFRSRRRKNTSRTDQEEEHAAAIAIQASFRGHRSRREGGAACGGTAGAAPPADLPAEPEPPAAEPPADETPAEEPSGEPGTE